MFDKYLDFSPEVINAIKNNKPIVALESTIISHGMPYPQNVETARKVEQIIRDNNAVPATIAIIDGRLKAGLTDKQLEYFGKAKNIKKVSRRDIPFVLANQSDGATTVSATMIIAQLANIKVFATGGVGGVHRGGEKTFDISADLQELAKTNVAVVSAGVKSILDIELTLEYLETNGVPVVGYKTDDFPAFYTSKSGYKVDYKVENPKQIAKALKAKWELNLDGGMIIGNPINKKDEMSKEIIDKYISKALDEADRKNIKGKDITPFLLEKIVELTDGESLKANRALVYQNAKVAADIAVEFSQLS